MYQNILLIMSLVNVYFYGINNLSKLSQCIVHDIVTLISCFRLSNREMYTFVCMRAPVYKCNQEYKDNNII